MPIHSLCRPFKLGLGFVAILVLSGCASMTEGECLTADWTDRGYRDGRQGYPVSRVADHTEACAGVGVVPNIAQYRRGHQKGIAEYCTPDNGLSEGRAGRTYRNACPAGMEARFLANYRLGYDVYSAEQRVSQLNSQTRYLESQLDKEKNKDKRQRIRRQLRDLDHQLRRARNNVTVAEDRIYHRRGR